MDIQKIYQKAYQLMDQAIIDSNCGLLCNYHCCRDKDETGRPIGMYLLPLEYEAVQKPYVTDYEIHSSKEYDIPGKLKKMYYIFCHEDQGCLRHLRPIQCRTYPFEPHLIDGKLHLIIEHGQFHNCPLLNQKDLWRDEFVQGIYKGWLELLKIPMVKYYVEKQSESKSGFDIFI